MKTPLSSTRRVGRPRRDEAANTSLRILDAAAQLFAAQGFAATSVEQVATACGAGKDTIYRRYASKRELFSAVVERTRQQVLKRLEDEIEALPQQDHALLRLKHVAFWFLQVNLDPELIAFRRIAMSEAALLADDTSSEVADADPIMMRLVTLVEEAQQAGFLRQGASHGLARHLLHSIVFGPSNDAMLGQTPWSTEAEQQAYFEQAWSLFLWGGVSAENRQASAAGKTALS